MFVRFICHCCKDWRRWMVCVLSESNGHENIGWLQLVLLYHVLDGTYSEFEMVFLVKIHALNFRICWT